MITALVGVCMAHNHWSELFPFEEVNVYSRSKEIILMRYIGATNFFITFPFIIQGTIIGLFSAGVGIGMQYFLYNYIMLDLFADYKIISFIPFSEFLPVLSIAFLCVGLFAGVIASVISVKRYLNK